MKRLAAPKALPLHDKKETTWLLRTNPGPHPKNKSIPLLVLIRDVMGLAPTMGEVRRILAERLVLVDGVIRTQERFAVGLMDVVSFPKADKNYRIIVDSKGRLIPVEISKSELSTKIGKVIGKTTIKGGKLRVGLHDGRNIVSDNNVHVGDSLIVGIPKTELKKHLKLQSHARCLITEGKHSGKIVSLKEIISRKAGKASEASVLDKDKTEFITVAKYLMVVDDRFGVSS